MGPPPTAQAVDEGAAAVDALNLTRRLRPLFWGLAAVGLLATVAWRVGAWNPSSISSDTNRLGAAGNNVESGLATYSPNKRSEAPSLEGTTLDGGTFALASLAGKIVVINVWGSWCAPCRAETPDLVRLAHKYANRQVRFVGINTRDNPAAARSFAKKFKVPYPSVEDTDGRLLLGFRNVIPTAVVPSSVVIDRPGRVAARVIGRVTYRTMSGLLDDEISASGRSS